MSYRRAFAAFGTFCALATVMAGCSSGGTASQPGAAGPATGAAASPVVTEVPQSTSGATATSSGLTVTITGLAARPALTPGGPAMVFTVDITNRTHRAFREITPVVAMEHCTCISTAAQPAPRGVLQEYVLATGKWQTVSYDTMGIGLDYLNVVEQPPLTLNPGATLSFTFRVRLRATAHQPLTVRAGQTGLLVTVVRHSGRPATTSSILAYTQIKVPVSTG